MLWGTAVFTKEAAITYKLTPPPRNTVLRQLCPGVPLVLRRLPWPQNPVPVLAYGVVWVLRTAPLSPLPVTARSFPAYFLHQRARRLPLIATAHQIWGV